MLRQQVIQNRFLLRAAWTFRRLRVRAKVTCWTHSHDTSWDAVHHKWHVRLFDCGHATRSYAIDLGHFPDRWFLGPSASVCFSRSDQQAGRPNSFRISSRQLEGLKTSGTDLSLGTHLAVEESFSFEVSDTAFSLFTQAYGAVLSVQCTQAYAERQLSRTNTLLHGDTSHLRSQTLRSECMFWCHMARKLHNAQFIPSDCRVPVSYTFDHPAGYHEQGTAFAHVQHTWGNIIVPHWLTCLGYHFAPDDCIQVPKYAAVPYKTKHINAFYAFTNDRVCVMWVVRLRSIIHLFILVHTLMTPCCQHVALMSQFCINTLSAA